MDGPHHRVGTVGADQDPAPGAAVHDGTVHPYPHVPGPVPAEHGAGPGRVRHEARGSSTP